MAASFGDAKAPENKHVQYLDNNGSDGIYNDGWYACTFGPLSPWLNAQPGLNQWDSSKAVWELYDLTKDFTQMYDLAETHPEKLAEMKKLFLAQAEENKVFPIGAGIWLRIHPEDRITASESFDVGTDLGSSVSRDYFDSAPFKFNGEIRTVTVELQ